MTFYFIKNKQGCDEAEIARRSQHDQSSVGRYLRDYERIKELVKLNIATTRIPHLLDLQPSVVEAYLQLLRLYRPTLFPSITLEDRLQ